MTIHSESEFEKLKRSLAQIIGGASSVPASIKAQANPKSFWQTPVGWAMAGGVLLIGVAALLATLKQIGLIDAPQVAVTTAGQSNDRVSPRIEQSSNAVERTTATENPPNSTIEKTFKKERVNLLYPENGAQIIAAAEENWRNILEAKDPKCSIISAKSFAVVGLGNEQPTTIAMLAVHVDTGSSYNLKTLAVFASDQERGPFKKIGEFEIPNFKNMRSPFHEYPLEPVTTRFVKVQVVSFVSPEIPNGNVCSIQVYGPK